MSTLENEAGNPANGRRRRITIYAIVLAVVFLTGLVPMWFVARARAAERDAAQRNLRLCRLENSLLSAAVDPAEVNMSGRVRQQVAFSRHCANRSMAPRRI